MLNNYEAPVLKVITFEMEESIMDDSKLSVNVSDPDDSFS